MYNSPVEEIKDRLDIVEVIGDYLDLKKVGKGYQALCPFHKEKTPSFHVSPDLQIFKCFGCGESGDLFNFIMKIEGIGFRDALKMMADRAGVELKEGNKELRSKRQKLEEILEWSAKFFQKQLTESKGGKKAQKYLQKRHINEESIKKWRLGYAPDSWDGLKNFLTEKGYSLDNILEAGLLVQKKDGSSVYDRFRGRLMFPIFNLHGVVIGYGGRILGDKKTAKYLNTPQTLLYNKSRVLYGINEAKLPIRDQEEVVLVEGYTDVIMSHQAGFENTVSVSGTALTPYQLKILNRYCDKVMLSFDMDAAGQKATRKSIKLAQKEGFLVRVIRMPEDRDPADIITDDPDQWSNIIDEAVTVFDFYFQEAFSKYDAEEPEGRKKITQELLPVIASLQDRIEQSHWVQELAQRLEVDEDSIRQEVRKYESEDEEVETSSDNFSLNNGFDRRELLERRVLILTLRDRDYLDLISDKVFNNLRGRIKNILNLFKDGELKKERENNRELDLWLKEKAFEVEQQGIEEEKDLQSCLRELEKIILKNELQENQRQIKKAESAGQEDVLQDLLKENKKINRKICQLNKQNHE